MATHTENYNLTMPAETDSYNVEDFNENFETIDAQMAENEAVCNEINKKIGSPENGETIFSLLKNSNPSVIKSIQHIIYKTKKDINNTTVSISPVDATKSFVLFERLRDNGTSAAADVSYSLNSSSINIEHETPTYDGRYIFGFWIIEFN